ncbi:CDP-glucose 4,6-dehydratase [Gammaproteobacteria bacterium 45_16_T64]|nr:CDP-glucose 4,6-dehydratase [Gammaproteobacteria bacterium 45_16_T64]
MFGACYQNKRVLVTGHTGFKGSWLVTWLLELGAEVSGVSSGVPTTPSIFEELELEGKIEHHIADVRDVNKLREIVELFQPDFVFHLAAQAIVSVSYDNPLDTLSTNVIGTANVLEALRTLNKSCYSVFITSDKCYENVEWMWGYRETDHMGGKDIYSASKGAAELIFHAYQQSFFKESDSDIRLATGRAGNVIGGGDWAADRIVADCMRAWSSGQKVEIRSPSSTRPWQHVLEPLSGYLRLGQSLVTNDKLQGEQFNFGPRAEQNHTVKQLLIDLAKYWDFEDEKDAFAVTADIPFHEAGLLKLNCDKALFSLKWESNLTYVECIKFVSEWYYSYYEKEVDMFEYTVGQIREYEGRAIEKSLCWTSHD